MKVQAQAKFVGTSSRKIGLVAALIRGKDVTTATRLLQVTNKRATDPVGKVLTSAIANAENNLNLKKADLMIESVLVGPAPTLKRFRPRAKGSASSIRKRSSHITVVLTDSKPATASKTPQKADNTSVEKTPIDKPAEAEEKK